MDEKTALEHAQTAGGEVAEFARRLTSLSPDDKAKLLAIAQRTEAMIEGLRIEKRRFDLAPVDARQCFGDWAVAHIQVGMRLDALLIVNDLDFFAEYWALCQAIDRPLCRVRFGHTLRFTQSA